MFPVPEHLPRTTRSDALRNGSAAEEAETPPAPALAPAADTVLDLFDDLVNEERGTNQVQNLTSARVKAVREKLQHATATNKTTSHELLLANFPTISSHIHLGESIRTGFRDIQLQVSQLERELDTSDTETSFVPPVLDLLQRHFRATRTVSRSRIHVSALTYLKAQAEEVDKLEEAVYAGRGADDWVVDPLSAQETGSNGYAVTDSGSQALNGTKIMQSIKAKRKGLRAMLVEQVTDGVGKAVAIASSSSSGFTSVKVQLKTSLQEPRIPRAGVPAPSKPTTPPPYSLTHIYQTLSTLHSLTEVLRTLQSRLLREFIQPIIQDAKQIKHSRTDTASSLTLEPSPPSRSPANIASDIEITLTFITETLFPPCPTPLPERESFLSVIHESTSQLLLTHHLIPTMPTSVASLQSWITTLRSAADFEAKVLLDPPPKPLIATFLENQAGREWANLRRRKVAEEVRRLILSGWGGWEGVEVTADKEITVLEEIEVEVEIEVKGDEAKIEDPATTNTSVAETQAGDAKQGKSVSDLGSNIGDSAMDVDVEEGWGFDEPPPPTSPAAGQADTPGMEVDGGWGFEDDLLPVAAPPPPPVIAKKPAREAKRLGKKVAKGKVAEEDIESGAESLSGSIAGPSIERVRSSSNGQYVSPAADDGWGAWADEEQTTTPRKQSEQPKKTMPEKQMRRELREVKRIIKETSLVSRACEKLLDVAERILHDAMEISKSPPSASFSSSPTVLYSATTDVFDLYRAILPTHFHAQIQSVPLLSMQVYNDSIHLASKLAELNARYTQWEGADTIRRLREGGEAHFEAQMESQRVALVSRLEEVGWDRMSDEASWKRGERQVKEVQSDLDHLSKVLKTVLPATTYLSTMGYLVDVTVAYVSMAILALPDITEVESERLDAILQVLRPLESIFTHDTNQPSSVVAHVPHWLKFCYISELLSANLVDILYLFDTRALVDFTTAELVNLIRALFADSDKRLNAIEKIERGHDTAPQSA